MMNRIMRERAAELVERQRTVHERVACPRCEAPIGERCVRASGRGWTQTDAGGIYALKHPHAERLQADGIELR